MRVNEQPHYGLKKLSIGLTSVVLGLISYNIENQLNVHADVASNAASMPSAVTSDQPGNGAGISLQQTAEVSLNSQLPAAGNSTAVTGQSADNTASAAGAAGQVQSNTVENSTADQKSQKSGQRLSTALPTQYAQTTQSTCTVNWQDPQTKQDEQRVITFEFGRQSDDDAWQALNRPGLTMNLPQYAGYEIHEIMGPDARDFQVITNGQLKIPQMLPGMGNININIVYAPVVVSQRLSLVNEQGQVIASQVVSGTLGQVVPVNLPLLDGYESVTAIPTTWQINGDKGVEFQVRAKVITIKPGQGHAAGGVLPGTNNIPYPSGVTNADLTHVVTRTVKFNYPDGRKQSKTQSATFTREAQVNVVTGQVTYGQWSKPQEVLETVDVPNVAGYTPDLNNVQALLKALTVMPDSQNVMVTVNYTQDQGTVTIDYLYPDDNSVVNTQLITGIVGQPVSLPALDIPTGFALVPGQDIPKNITIGQPAGQHITIYVQGQKININHDQPVPGGTDVPNTNGEYQYPDGVNYQDLNQTITRTINITTPDGHTQTVRQIAKLHRDAKLNVVTGKITYLPWSVDQTSWAAFQPTTVDGYTVTPAEIPAVVVRDGQQDVTIDVTYQKLAQPASGNAQSTTSQLQEQAAVTGKVSDSEFNKNASQTLPQTSGQQDAKAAGMGAWVAGLATSVLALGSRKKRNHN